MTGVRRTDIEAVNVTLQNGVLTIEFEFPDGDYDEFTVVTSPQHVESLKRMIAAWQSDLEGQR